MRVNKHLYHTVLWLVALLFFAPILWIFLSSFKTIRGILATPPQFFFTPTLANYQELFSRPNVLPYFANSILISLNRSRDRPRRVVFGGL